MSEKKKIRNMLLERFEVRTQKSSNVQNFISIVMLSMPWKFDRNTTNWKLRGIVIYDRICWEKKIQRI